MKAKSILFRCILYLLLSATVTCPAATGRIIYVDDDGHADFNTIQAAIDDANDGDTILVAPGTYTGDGNRDIDFTGKAITVKSEEGPETCIIDCQGTSNEPHRGFYFHDSEDSNSVVQGFTVTHGYARPDNGGAFYCKKSSPIIRDCIILGNTARDGGGIYAYQSDVLIENCIIRENTASFGSTNSEGGGISVYHGNAQLRNCLIMGNTTSGLGGGIYCFKGDHQIINCTITGNRTGNRGGGISIGPGSVYECYLCNSVVWSNSAGMFGDNIELGYAGILSVMHLNVSNSLIGEDPNSVYDPFEHISGQWLMTDPLFARNGYWDPNGTQEDPYDDFWIDGDYHLKSQAGRWDPNSQSWVIDEVTSPCIDAGDPNTPIGDEPFPNGGIVNMGAYGGTAEASKSYTLAKIIYVDDDGPADFNTIQAAIDDANDGDTVLVAPGIYTGDGNRDIKFKGKAITVKSEDGPENCIINCQGAPDEPHGGFHFGDRYYNDANSILQGFTIVNGYTNSGGGISCSGSSPLIIDCIIRDNVAIWGGGIDCALSSNLTLINCIIYNNTAKYGGGVSIRGGEPTFTNCFITGNNATVGGGVFISGGKSTFTNCFITGNKAEENGGGVYCGLSSIEVLNCTIFGNWACIGGGGIYFSPVVGTQIKNSILYGNMALTGSEIASYYFPGVGGCPEYPFINITHSVVGNDPNSIDTTKCPNLVSGQWLHIDPLFAEPGYWDSNGTLDHANDDIWVEGDYHLKSQAGRFDPNSQSWVVDDITSPCIDAGDPNNPVGDEPIPNGGVVNMGAYGGTAEASKSISTTGIITR